MINDGTAYLFAVEDHGVVGYAAGGPIDDAEWGALDTIYVCPDRWCDGIGSRLFDTVTEQLRERGFERCQTPVLADNNRPSTNATGSGYRTARKPSLRA